VGRHGGTSGERYTEPGNVVDNRNDIRPATVVAGARHGVRTRPARLEDVSGSASAHPWWDDAPVPPPVVVASADRRTPAVSFAPDADPFSEGGVFAAPGGRDGEPAVVVHPAPDAAVLRTSRRQRTPGRVGAPDGALSLSERTGGPAGGRSDTGGPQTGGPQTGGLQTGGPETSGPETGSLVRPYVAQSDPDVPGTTASAPTPPNRELPKRELSKRELPKREPRDARRGSRRSGGPLDRIIEPGPPAPAAPRPVAEWRAPWPAEARPPADRPAPSLFEPATQAVAGGAWAPPSDQSLPSRKALRAQERAALTDAGERESVLRAPGRRLAKSGVLAVTAVGVVAASAPNAFSAFGWQLPSHPGGPQARSTLVGLAGSGSLPAPEVTLGSPAGSALLGASVALSAPQDNAASARRDAAAVAKASAAAAARAGAVAAGTGRTLVDVARTQVLAEAARKTQIVQRISRNTVRDPRSYARLLLQQRGWSGQFTCLNLLWNRESGWSYRAYNPSSGAYGIPQSLPGSKMASIASDWQTNPATQIRWGLNYIAERYGTPCGAWSHSQATGWY
jgi:hypothetical protein